MKTQNDTGITYLIVGSDDKYLREFKKSYNSLRNHYDGAVTLITDKDIKLSDLNIITVDSFGCNRQSYLLNKPKYLPLSPYKKTIFLDTDTIILEDFSELFILLDNFDFCATIGPMDFNWPCPSNKLLPGYMPYNTGVLGYTSNECCQNVFTDWFKNYKQYLKTDLPKDFSDQTPFNEAVFLNKAYVCTLPNNYNLRTVFPGILVKHKIKIVHDRNVNKKFIDSINTNLDMRVITKT